ncbi:MAG TPA: peptide chain release factor-like protein [Oligoflexia bacterium]|nr:peptide chain release factor-like protein [Oligoflexia bacterium]HMP49648.1 peptide chain release factor-like protein [Oligoflexia bacterium]
MALSLGVSLEKKTSLLKRMAGLGIREEDINEKFVKGSGPGGQKINKTSSCVHLFFDPLKIEIKCQKTRSQALNRYYARVQLCDEIEDILLQERSKKSKERDKIRRNKQKRSKRAQEKILKDKKAQSEKKVLRSKKTLDQ